MNKKKEDIPFKCTVCGENKVFNPADGRYYCVKEGCLLNLKCRICGANRAVCSC